MTEQHDWLRKIRIDWSNFSEATRISRQIVEGLAADRGLLRRLVLLSQRDVSLRSLAEKHGELDYIVLYDALDRGIRVRLHRFTQGLEDIPHNHRFSFSSALLEGSYVHTVFGIDDGAGSGEFWELEQPKGSHEGVEVEKLDIAALTPQLVTVQARGSSFTLHHSAIHKTAMPVENAYSVFCRGPAEKPAALQLQPDRKSYRWKFGRDHETPDVIAARKMSGDELTRFVSNLEEAQII